MGVVKNNEVVFDSTKMQSVGGPRKKGLSRFYFPLIIVIVLAEAVALGFILFDMVPVHTFEVYPYAQYGQYVNANDLTAIATVITKWFFFLLTAGVLIPTTIIILLEIIRRFITTRRGEQKGWDDDFGWLEKLDKKPKLTTEDKKRVEGEYIKRFDVHQRIQHYALMGSFIVLAVTGLLRGFPDWPTFQWFTSIFGGTDVLRLVHDIAAFVMIVDCVYHLGYIAYGYFVKKRSPSAMFPKWKDLKDIIETTLWIFGFYKKEPKFDHFQYGQKIDYWAIFWGMPVMVITGIIMMFPAFFSQWMGGTWFAALATAHRDEAILATGFILIVHMYYGHLQTTAFPVNTVMFTGKMLKSKYKRWFGREYEQLTDEKEPE
jgi:formate dehydrogenase subunit gamma